MSQTARPAFGNVALSVSGRTPSAPAAMPQSVGSPAMPQVMVPHPMMPPMQMQMMPAQYGMMLPEQSAGQVGQPMNLPGYPNYVDNGPLPGKWPPANPDARFAQLLRALGPLGDHQHQLLAQIAAYVGEVYGADSESQKEVLEWASRLDSRPREIYERGPVAAPAEQEMNASGFRPWVVGKAS